MSGWLRKVVKGGAILAVACGGIGAGVGAWAASTAGEKLAFPDTPYPDLKASTDPEVIARGEYLVRGPAHCSQCHSGTDRNAPEQVLTEPLHGGMEFAMGPLGSLFARNLTSDAETGIGRRTDAELARVLRTGVLPEGELSVFMRYSAANLSDEDVIAVISYLRATEPVRNEVPNRQLTTLGLIIVRLAFPEMLPRAADVPVGVPAGEEPSVERGEYLAENVMLCNACHTEYDPATFEPTGPKGGGGLVEVSKGDDTDMEYWPPNLTSHPTGVTGKLDEDAFLARIRAGRAHTTSIMPWENFGQATDADLRSVYRYLKSLPPVDNDQGPTYRPVGWVAAK